MEILHDGHLQAEARQRHAEHEDAVHGALDLERRAARFEQRDRDVVGEEQHEERLDRREVLARVIAMPPEQPEHERADEAEHVERAPGATPRQREDGAVQHREVTEQRQRRAARRGEQRREKAAGDREPRQRLRIGAQREPDRERGDADQQRDRDLGRKHVVEPQRRVDREVQDAGAGALQRQPVGRSRGSHPQAESDQRAAGQRDAGQAQLDRHGEMLGEVAQQEGDAEEQHDDADPGERIAAGEPRPHRVGRSRRGRRAGLGRRRERGRRDRARMARLHRGERRLRGSAGPQRWCRFAGRRRRRLRSPRQRRLCGDRLQRLRPDGGGERRRGERNLRGRRALARIARDALLRARRSARAQRALEGRDAQFQLAQAAGQRRIGRRRRGERRCRDCVRLAKRRALPIARQRRAEQEPGEPAEYRAPLMPERVARQRAGQQSQQCPHRGFLVLVYERRREPKRPAGGSSPARGVRRQ